MNERINELIGKALDQAVPYTWHHLNCVQVDDTMKKFAELIVRECIDEIKHLRRNYDTHQDVEPDENDWYIDAFLQAEVRLKEHFGVEEK